MTVTMASSIYIQKVCEFCKNEFTARTVKTRYCSHKCNSRDYKKKKRQEKITTAKREVQLTRTDAINQEVVTAKEFMNTKEAALLLGVSERTLFRLIKEQIVKTHKLGHRTIIRKEDINNLFK